MLEVFYRQLREDLSTVAVALSLSGYDGPDGCSGEGRNRRYGVRLYDVQMVIIWSEQGSIHFEGI